MPPKHEFTVRFDTTQYRMLQKLSAQLGIKQTEVLRLALARLAQAEGLTKIPAQN
jgi:hypothetical protein